MLAAVSLRHADEDVPELLPAALRDVGPPCYEWDSTAGREAAVTTIAERTLAGPVAPRDLARWAYRVFGHGTLELAERLVEFDDVYDTLDYCDVTDEEVDAEVLVEARRIAGAAHATDPSPSGRTGVSTCDNEPGEGRGCG